MADTTGWIQQTNPYEYEANFRLAMKTGQELKKQTVPVVTNKSSGDYTVYKDNGLLPKTSVYNFSAATGKESIVNQVDFDSLFTGENAPQFGHVNKQTKKATVALAKEGILDQDTRSKFTKLINSPGYFSLGKNVSTTNPNDQNNDLRDGAPASGGEELPNRVQAQSFTVGGSVDVLRYPRQSLEQFGYDYIQITAYEYEASGLDVQGGGKGGFGKRFKKSYETIQLPMQPNLSESLGVAWGEDNLNGLQAALASGAMGLMQDVAGGKMKEAGGKISDTMQDMGAMVKDPASKKFVAAYFAGQAVGANVTARATGQVINPNLELMFTGPQLRSFNFNFTLTPRDPEEARICRKIIRAMKRNMTPQRSESNLFLKTPRIFKIEYIYGEGNTEHPFMNKFKPCACRNFTVNYTPDGSYMTYRGEPSMTSYTIAMSFGEIEPIYADEYKGNTNSPTMGF